MTTRVLVVAMLAVSLLPAVHLKAAEGAKARAWRVKYMDGPITIQDKYEERDLPEGSRLRVTIANSRIVVSRKNRNVLTVSVAEVTKVSYYHLDDSRSKQVFGEVSVWQDIGECERGALLCAALLLPVYAASASLEYRNHFVRIAWRSEPLESGKDEGFDQDVEFKVGKRDWSAFLSELAKVTGKRWKDESPQISDPNELH